MASLPEQTTSQLLKAICSELSEDKSQELLSLVVKNLNTDQQYVVLQCLYNNGALDLDKLAQDLANINCQPQSEKVNEFIQTGAEQNDKVAAIVGPGMPVRRVLSFEGSPGKRKQGAIDYPSKEAARDDYVDDTPVQQPRDVPDDKHYMQMAIDVSKKSPDGRTKVGSVLYNPATRRDIASGYNRMTKGCENQPWSCPEEDSLEAKYYYVLHSAVDAIIQAAKMPGGIEGTILYTTLFPAYKDAQLIVEYGIKELVYLDDIYYYKNFTKASKRILRNANIQVRRLDPECFKDSPCNYYVM